MNVYFLSTFLFFWKKRVQCRIFTFGRGLWNDSSADWLRILRIFVIFVTIYFSFQNNINIS